MAWIIIFLVVFVVAALAITGLRTLLFAPANRRPPEIVLNIALQIDDPDTETQKGPSPIREDP